MKKPFTSDMFLSSVRRSTSSSSVRLWVCPDRNVPDFSEHGKTWPRTHGLQASARSIRRKLPAAGSPHDRLGGFLRAPSRTKASMARRRGNGAVPVAHLSCKHVPSAFYASAGVLTPRSVGL
eukprot:scaffold2808_cov255-Pinguiococcus_pyrenoidosus.AAC.28